MTIRTIPVFVLPLFCYKKLTYLPLFCYKKLIYLPLFCVVSPMGYLIPVEIKSGKTGSLKSLHQFVNQSIHPYAVRIYGGEFKIEETKTPEGKPYLLMNLPYYSGTLLMEYLEILTSNRLNIK